jgi:ELWxxDGT repeat protein
MLYFAANDGSSGTELWASDGTLAGTQRVQDIAPGPANANPGGLAIAGDRLFFGANSGAVGRELWAMPLLSPAPPPTPTPVRRSVYIPMIRR